jgi:glycosyltransferase involved in cell wall biosynthesis
MVKPRQLLVLCPFPQGVAAGQRLKYEQYFDSWRSNGYEIVVSSFMDEALWAVVYAPGNYPAKVAGVIRGHVRRLRDMMRVRAFDLVYVFMWVTPVGTSLFERLTRALARRLIFDVEDSVLVGQNLPASAHPNALVQLLKGTGKATYLIRTADHVITSSPFLNEDCLKINRRKACTYITSSVEVERYVATNAYTNNGKVTIGWTGTFSSKIYFDLLRGVFQRLAQSREFRLVVIGNFDYELSGIDLEVLKWTKELEIEQLQGLDIGVYPLPIDDWVLGKSGLKAIQYMAMALPVVATNVGMSPRIIEDGVNGILVETEDEWVAALQRLIDEPELRRRLGAAGRKSVEENYSTWAVRGQYLDVFEEIGGLSSQSSALSKK